jgi:limonene-1,2-epoxide hydrolase
MRCGPISVVSNDRQVFTERLDRFVSRGVEIDHYLVAVFDISVDGRIAAWREYFDPEDVNRQLRAVGRKSATKDDRSS